MTVSRRQALALGGLGLAAVAVGACSLYGTEPATAPSSDDPPRRQRLTYGEHASQVADLSYPDRHPDGAPRWRGGRPPVVALLHGGFWQAAYDRTLMEPLVDDLVARGWAVLNVEYRRVGEQGGGWPGTFVDVGAALDLLAAPQQAEHVDHERVLTMGHSAGGHLALWAAARDRLPSDAPGADPSVRPVGAIGQSAVCDLISGAQANLGGGACASLLGGSPTEVPDRYELASPAARLPLGIPQLLVHTTDDTIVPPNQSQQYAAAATEAGDQCDLVMTEGDHFAHLNPIAEAWLAVVDRLESLLPE